MPRENSLLLLFSGFHGFLALFMDFDLFGEEIKQDAATDRPANGPRIGFNGISAPGLYLATPCSDKGKETPISAPIRPVLSFYREKLPNGNTLATVLH
jgi:hypothetical protein